MFTDEVMLIKFLFALRLVSFAGFPGPYSA